MIENEENQNIKEEIKLLKKICSKTKKKIITKIEKQQSEFEKNNNWLWYKQMGDSILAISSTLKKGLVSTKIQNVHTEKEESLTLNPKLDAIKNAEKFYRKSKKGKRGLAICAEKLAQSKNELKGISNIETKLQDLLSNHIATEILSECLQTIQKTMKELGLISTLVQKNKSNPQYIKIPYRHLTYEGWDIYIGKNDQQNDELTIKFAKPWDIWFHVAVHAGSHVVLQRKKNTEWPPKNIIETVAAFTAWFSKAKHTSYTEVTVTEARFVRKRRKSPPGQVVVERYKTVRVTPMSPQELFKNKID